jgi:hypothetical protein
MDRKHGTHSEKTCIYNFLLENPFGRGHSGQGNVEKRMILKWILNRILRMGIGIIWL